MPSPTIQLYTDVIRLPFLELLTKHLHSGEVSG